MIAVQRCACAITCTPVSQSALFSPRMTYLPSYSTRSDISLSLLLQVRILSAILVCARATCEDQATPRFSCSANSKSWRKASVASDSALRNSLITLSSSALISILPAQRELRSVTSNTPTQMDVGQMMVNYISVSSSLSLIHTDAPLPRAN